MLYAPVLTPELEKQHRAHRSFNQRVDAKGHVQESAPVREPTINWNKKIVEVMPKPEIAPKPEYKPWFRIVGLERPTVRDIQEVVAEFYGITRADILSKCRTTKFTFPRQVAAYLAKEITGLSLPDIGRRFSGRDHTTILYSVNKVAALRKSDPMLADEITEIKYRLEAL